MFLTFYPDGLGLAESLLPRQGVYHDASENVIALNDFIFWAISLVVTVPVLVL